MYSFPIKGTPLGEIDILLVLRLTDLVIYCLYYFVIVIVIIIIILLYSTCICFNKVHHFVTNENLNIL